MQVKDPCGQHFVVDISSYSQDSEPWTATYGSLPLIGCLDGSGYELFLIIRFIHILVFLHTRKSNSGTSKSRFNIQKVCAVKWYLYLLSTDSKYLINIGHYKMGHSRHNRRVTQHSREAHTASLLINLFTSLTKLKFSCNHEYMNEAARENAHWRADKMGQYQ